jgi:hypothetical protein
MKNKLQNLLLALALLASVYVARSANITWTNVAGGDWNTAQNWDLNQVPGSGDSASIPGGGINVLIDATNSTGGLTLGNGSSLTIATGGVLNIEGSINVQGELTNAGTVNWEGGSIAVYGPAQGYTGEIWNQAGALWDIQCDQALIGEYGSEVFHNAGVVQKDTTTGATSFNVYLNNTATVHAESGTINFNSGSDLGGVFHADTGAAIYFSGGAYTLNGAPDFQGPGVVQFIAGNVTLNGLVGPLTLNGAGLSGQSTVTGTGTLNLVGGTLNNGSSLTIATGGVLNIEGSINVQGELTNAGTVNWEGGSIAVYGPAQGYTGEIWNQAGALWDIQCDQALIGEYGSEVFHNAGVVQKDTTTGATSFNVYLNNTATVHAESGTINFNSGSDLGGVFHADTGAAIYFSGGAYTLNGAPDFQGPGVVQFIAGNVTLNGLVGPLTLNGAGLSGQSTVTGTGTLNLVGGTLNNGSSLTIATGGVLNIEGSINVQGELTNAGTVNWEGGSIAVYGPAQGYTGEIWNQAGALWDIQCDQALIGEYGSEVFHNAGVVQKDTTTGATSFNVYLNNTATVHAESGTINFNSGSDLGGVFHADTGAAIYFSGGAYTLNGAPDFQGPGVVQFIAGNVTLNGLVGPLTLNGAGLSGQSTVTGTGTLNLVGGTLNNGSSLTIATGGVLNIEGSINVQGELTNAGTVNWEGGSIAVYGPAQGYTGEIWNQAGALWDIQCDQALIGEYGSEVFHNAGVVQKDTTTGATSFNVYLNNGAVLKAESGMISLNEGYTETSSASQVIGIGGTTPGSGYGQIAFSSATFAGSFNVTLLNGFRPSPGDSFSVLSYPSITGDFTSMNGLDLGNGLKLVPHFGNTGLILVAATYQVNAKPSLSLYPTPNDVLVSWPLNFTGWQLQTTTNLATHVWTAITVNGTNNNTVLPRTGSQGFFRLKSN